MLGMTNPTPLQQLLELKLNEPLEAFIAERRQIVVVERPSKSWAEIADEIRERTGMEVSRETLRNWSPEAGRDAA